MGKLLGANAPDSLDEVLYGGAEVVVRCRSRDGDGVVRHPSYSLGYSLSIGGFVPDTIATVVLKAGAKIISVRSMWIPRSTLSG